MITRPVTRANPPRLIETLFAGAAGLFLGLSLLKFGNPVILDRLVATPAGLLEFIFQPWPFSWSYGFSTILIILGVLTGPRWFKPPSWLVFLPLVWLAWQYLAATRTIDAVLTQSALIHFSVVVGGYCLAYCALAKNRRAEAFWVGLLAGFWLMLWAGLGQHYGGLEATRNFIYSQPGWEKLDPEHLKRVASNRIFATLLYPNALAGVLLLVTPAMLVTVWRLGCRLNRVIRAVLTGVTCYASIACMVWSGSKAGWLITLVLLLVCVFQLDFPRRLKHWFIVMFLLFGMAGFFLKFSAYFAKGATSVGARMEYWKSGWRTAWRNPVLGTGPGTFALSYRRQKPPEAEMALLAHNDFLQQASDSGFPGAMAYVAFLGGSLAWLYRRCRWDGCLFAVWLGLLGWTLQSFVEFGLYIPATGWTAFWLAGWLWGVQGQPLQGGNAPPNRIDSRQNGH